MLHWVNPYNIKMEAPFATCFGFLRGLLFDLEDEGDIFL
jgi:hypothetical protein